MFLDEEARSLTAKVLSISELTDQIKELLQEGLGFISVRGEITNFRPAASGHVYFGLKDEASLLSAVLFRNSLSRVRGVRLENGAEVVCRGRISVYGPRGSYQIVVEQVEAVGAGSLQAQFEALKAKLQMEGLFSSERKRAIPKMPAKIAVITSPTGAAIRDVISVLQRRHAGVPVLVIPSLVQGAGADEELIFALKQANDPRVGADVILLTRGGGSLEDLWCFNSEKLARAIAASRLPVVSAVGHEVDFTIADFVADLRAATPSAAAELLVQEQAHLLEMVMELTRKLQREMMGRIQMARMVVREVSAKLKNPRDRIAELRQRFDEWLDRLEMAMRGRLDASEVQRLEQALAPAMGRVLERNQEEVEDLRETLQRAITDRLRYWREDLGKTKIRLEALSPLAVLDRGYSLVYLGNGTLLKSKEQARVGDALRIQTAQGELGAEVKRI